MQSPPVKNNKKAKTFIIFYIAIIIAVLFAVFLNEDKILISSESIDHSMPITTNVKDLSNSSTYVQSKECEPSNDTHQTVSNNNLTLIPDIVEDNVHSYEKIYDTHLNFLQEMNYVIVKFFQDLPYTNHINYIKSQNLPQELHRLFAQLDEYNANFLVNSAIIKEEDQLIFPRNDLFIKKFITVKKVSNIPKAKDELKSIIIKGLSAHIQYLYNNKLLQDSSTNRLE